MSKTNWTKQGVRSNSTWTEQSISPSSSWTEQALSSIGSIWAEVLTEFSLWASFNMEWEDSTQNWEDF
jgi:hypothetical protein|tara:strand:+ start:575 stop:778 length:204 start_codon:yes stop_codon:yes gene_type:complete